MIQNPFTMETVLPMKPAASVQPGIRPIMTVAESPQYEWRRYEGGLKVRGSRLSDGPSGPTTKKLIEESRPYGKPFPNGLVLLRFMAHMREVHGSGVRHPKPEHVLLRKGDLDGAALTALFQDRGDEFTA